MFMGYAVDMALARARRDALHETEGRAYYDMLERRSTDSPIGRHLAKQVELPKGRRLKLDLTLLNESVGNMPDYRQAEAHIKKIGRVGVLLHDISEHAHFASRLPRFQTLFACGLDILSSGEVHLSSSRFAVCDYCQNVDIEEELKVLDRLGLETLYLDQAQHEIPHDDGQRMYILRDQRFNEKQMAGLQSFLRDHLSS